MLYFQFVDSSVNDLRRAQVRPVDGEGSGGVAELLGRLWYGGLAGEVGPTALEVQALQHRDQGGVLLLGGGQLPGKLGPGTQGLRLLL